MNRQQNSLQLPLLGTLTRKQLEETLIETITDEASAAEFYTKLLSQAPDQLNYDFVEHARNDELEHLSFFEKLYIQYFGKKPQYKIEPVRYNSYKEGLLIALKDELAAGEFYRDVQLSVRDPLIRDTYYYAMVDELRHATMFSTLYNQNRF